MRSNRIGGAIFSDLFSLKLVLTGTMHLKKHKEMIYYNLIQNFSYNNNI